MDNISWSKTVGNWGANEQEPTVKKKKVVTKKKEPISYDFQISIENLTKLCDELHNSALDMYGKKAFKDLSDILIHTKLIKDSIKNIKL